MKGFRMAVLYCVDLSTFFFVPGLQSAFCTDRNSKRQFFHLMDRMALAVRTADDFFLNG